MGNLKSFHRNIEFDQMIFIEKEINNTFPITIFNSDGGEVSACVEMEVGVWLTY